MTKITKTSTIVIIFAILVTIGFNIYSTNYARTISIAESVWDNLWPITPYIFLLLFLRRSDLSRKQSMAMLTASIVAAVLGIGLFVDTFFIHPDAQAGLSWMFVPILQWVACALALFINFMFIGNEKKV